MKPLKAINPKLKKTIFGTALGVGVFLLIFFLYISGLISGLENRVRDLRFRLFAEKDKADSNIVIIAVDEESLNFYRRDLGTWPWPREVFGTLVDFLESGGADTIVFDMMFAEPDISDPSSDSVFSSSAEKSKNVITSLVFLPSPQPEASEDYESKIKRLHLKEHFSLSVKNDSDIDLFDYSSVTLPYLRLLSASKMVGSINFVADPDGPSRTVFPLFRYRDSFYPSLALASAMSFIGLEPSETKITIEKNNTLKIEETEIPLLPDGRMFISWHGPYGTYHYYPIGDIFESMISIRKGEVPRVMPQEFEGKIVLVGATAVSLFDLRATPFSPVYPGVELNATVIDNIVNGDYVWHSPFYVTTILVFLFAVSVSLISVRVASPSFGIIVFFLLWISFTLISVYLFASNRIMVDYLAPTGSLFLSFFGSAVFNYITEGRAKRKFKDAFAKYLSPQVVDEISKNIDNLKLDVGDRTEITILFSDIRGFTSMSEKLPPEEVVKRLNRYLDVMVEVIFKYDGTLDKYMGDAIMAFFGAPKAGPDHAKTACLAALSMHEELKRLNEELEREDTPPMTIGIGINTGEVVVGNIGSERRMDYTIIGDHVNLASRLQGLTKEFGTEIIISEFTARAADGLKVRDLGEVKIRGKEKPVRILELLGVSEIKDD